MRITYPLCLSVCVRAVQSLGSIDSCLWRPAPPCLACGIDDLEEPRFLAQPASRETKRHEKAPPRWEGPGRCAGKFCIYANRGFADGQGIVAITTTSSLNALKKLEATSSYSTQSTPYYLAEVPGKGLGLIANRTLHRGDAVMVQPPAVLIHRGLLETIAPAEQYPLLDAAITQLPASRRESFLAQMGHFGGHRVADILATNSFQMDLGGPDGHHYGNFPEVSRFNHDCRPNVAFRVDKKTLTHTTTAVRDVAPGEELSITYLDSAEPRAKRMHRAHQAWGFACGCSQCRLSDTAAAQSDRRLEEIKEIETRLSDFASAGVNAGLLRKLVRLYRDERMEVELAGAYTLVALNYNMLGDAGMAVKYARLAREAVIIEGGEEAGDAEAMRLLAEGPKEHFTWRVRVG